MKKPIRKSKLEQLDEIQRNLEKKLSQAYRLGMGEHVIIQLQTMLEQNRLELYDEYQMEEFRREGDDNDGESFIV